jgi:hypothetical protein
MTLPIALRDGQQTSKSANLHRDAIMLLSIPCGLRLHAPFPELCNDITHCTGIQTLRIHEETLVYY